LVIIEEPEAHLHPDAQRNLVRLLVRLVNRGVRVLLITHSPYVLQQINNCILINRLDENKKKRFLEKHGYDEEDALNPNLVSAYLFELHRGKSRVKSLEIGLEGIPYDAFYSTLMELSKETRELRRLVYESGDGES
jgi:predicted ATPase